MTYDYCIQRNMVNHRPDKATQEKMEAIRLNFHEVTGVILGNVAVSRERSLAITKLEEALMWTMASLARGNYDDLTLIDQAGTVELSGHATGHSGVNRSK